MIPTEAKFITIAVKKLLADVVERAHYAVLQ
jgi:hypothetical protein